MICSDCEEKMSDYLDDALDPIEHAAMEAHFCSCPSCGPLIQNMTDILDWARNFPVHDAPQWLAARIVANTPRIQRETWADTFWAIGRYLLEPRTAIGAFTAAIVLGWMGNMLGILPAPSTLVRNPSAAYYEPVEAVNRAYDEAIRRFYRTPLVTQIQSQIDRIRESS